VVYYFYIYSFCEYIAKNRLVNSYYCDINTQLDRETREQVDSALHLELHKKSLYYGCNHSNPMVNRLKKGVKDSHGKIVKVLKAAQNDPQMKEVVESVGFKKYFHDPDVIDPDVKHWSFKLGPKHKPYNIDHSYNDELAGRIDLNDGTRRSSRVALANSKNELDRLEQLQKEAEEQVRAEEEAAAKLAREKDDAAQRALDEKKRAAELKELEKAEKQRQLEAKRLTKQQANEQKKGDKLADQNNGFKTPSQRRGRIIKASSATTSTKQSDPKDYSDYDGYNDQREYDDDTVNESKYSYGVSTLTRELSQQSSSSKTLTSQLSSNSKASTSHSFLTEATTLASNYVSLVDTITSAQIASNKLQAVTEESKQVCTIYLMLSNFVSRNPFLIN
jgi:hypothetical protein